MNQISNNVKFYIHDLHSKFKDPGQLDKTVKAQSTLDMVTGVMKDNVAKMFANRDELDDIENKSTNIRDTANRFKMHSHKLEKMSRMRSLKMKMILALIAFILIAVLYYTI